MTNYQISKIARQVITITPERCMDFVAQWQQIGELEGLLRTSYADVLDPVVEEARTKKAGNALRIRDDQIPFYAEALRCEIKAFRANKDEVLRSVGDGFKSLGKIEWRSGLRVSAEPNQTSNSGFFDSFVNRVSAEVESVRTRLDNALISYIEETGCDAPKVLEIFRGFQKENPTKGLMDVWLGKSPKALVVLFLCRSKTIKHTADRLARTGQPALVYPVFHGVHALHSHCWKNDKGQPELPNVNAVKLIPPTISDAALRGIATEAMRDQGLILFGTLTAHRLLRWEITAGHEEYGKTGDRVLNVRGGWNELAERIGVPASRVKDAARDVQAIVHAQAYVNFQFADGLSGPMLSYRAPTNPNDKRITQVEITLGTVLLPQYVKLLEGKQHPSIHASKLVPMPSALPPFGDIRPNDHGRVASLQLETLREMRLRATELVEHGGVFLNVEDLGSRFRLSPTTVRRVIDIWVAGDDKTPAFLQWVGAPWNSRLTLTSTHRLALEFMLDGGQRELNATRNGQLSAESRRRANRGKR